MIEARTPSDKMVKAGGLAAQMSSMMFIRTLLLCCDLLPIMNRLSLAFQAPTVDYCECLEAVERALAELDDLMEAKGDHEQELGDFVADVEAKVRSYAGIIKEKREAGQEMNPGVGNLIEELEFFNCNSERARRGPNYVPFGQMRKQYIAAQRDSLLKRFAPAQMPVVVGLCNMFNPKYLPPSSAPAEQRREFAAKHVAKVLEWFAQGKDDAPAIIDRSEFESSWPACVRALGMCKEKAHERLPKDQSEVRMCDLLQVFLTDKTLTAQFPEAALLAERILALPPTSVDPERGFSALKRIKRKDRNRVSSEMLDAWLMIALEGPKPGAFNLLRPVVQWYLKQSRRVQLRWIDAMLQAQKEMAKTV
jgi:hypothetical protein